MSTHMFTQMSIYMSMRSGKRWANPRLVNRSMAYGLCRTMDHDLCITYTCLPCTFSAPCVSTCPADITIDVFAHVPLNLQTLVFKLANTPAFKLANTRAFKLANTQKHIYRRVRTRASRLENTPVQKCMAIHITTHMPARRPAHMSTRVSERMSVHRYRALPTPTLLRTPLSRSGHTHIHIPV